MKKLYTGALFLTALLCSSSIFAQLTNGDINANFGVDGDTRNNYVKYGPATGLILSDDWFSAFPSGYNVIDTSNAANYLSLLQSGSNIGFNKRMSVPLYSKINGKLWLDAVYGRDYVSTNPLFDSTIFTIAAKNGDNPTNWQGGTSNTPDKNDLLDVYAHMRRDGTNVHDSLWFFTGVSTVGTSGSRYFDIELYKNNFSYNSLTGAFSTAGTDAGHTQWIFDASGNIIQTGDMIVAVNFTPGSAPVVDLRIWVSQSTFATVVPAYFNFGPNFDGATPAFGYASILSKSGATAFGSGIANYSGTAAQDTTYSTPWGTEQSTKNWGTQYLSEQFIEIGLNLTRIGVDPALYSAFGLNPCQSLFSDIFFKSRSSNSFLSNMQDFVTPLTFLRNPVMDYSLTPDTLRCNKSVGTIQIANNSTAGYYVWQTANGNISGSNADSSQLNINKPGTYIVNSSPAIGCPATRADTVVIPIDTFPPVASFTVSIGSNFSYLQLNGGDLAASNYMTPFGGSQGLLWNWSGPQSFTSSVQNPITDTAWGTYQLIVTEKRNGCKDTAVQILNIYDFGTLATQYFVLNGKYVNNSVQLSWKDQDQNLASYYTIEKLGVNNEYREIGTVILNKKADGSSTLDLYTFIDGNPQPGDNIYRIKATSASGQVVYSNTVKVTVTPDDEKSFYFITNPGGDGVTLVYTSKNAGMGTVVIYNVTGATLLTKTAQIYKGVNQIDLPLKNGMKYSVLVGSLYISNQLVGSKKIIF
jgi:hypothetical protein